MKNILIPIMAILLLSNCIYDPPERKIRIYNNTDSTIYVYWSCSDSITYKNPLNLFNIYNLGDLTNIYGRPKSISVSHPRYRLNAYSWGSISGTGQKDLLESCLNKKIRIFYISEEIMRTNSWDKIVSGQLYIRKEIFGIEDLEPYDWTIEYNN